MNEPREQTQGMTPMQWLLTGDTGVSSRAILEAVTLLNRRGLASTGLPGELMIHLMVKDDGTGIS